MNWNNLKQGICPQCNGDQKNEGRFVGCYDCEFKIRKSKYFDLIKGKKSKAYQKAVEHFKFLKERAAKTKLSRKLAKELQDKERAYNLAKIQREKVINTT